MDASQRLNETTPEIIEPLTIMNKLNELIEVHDGEFTLKSAYNEYQVYGKIIFHWFPNTGLRFSGKVKANHNLIKEYQALPSLEISIGQNKIGECVITALSENRPSADYVISGIVPNKSVFGDKSVNVTKVHFEVVNLKEFLGSIVKKPDTISFLKNRITLEDKKYVIHLDKRIEYKNLKEQLKETGGIVTLYSCNLLKKKGDISYKEVESISKCLYFFLCFINGRRVSPVFLKGITDGSVYWEEYFSYRCSPYKHVESWSDVFDITGFSKLWEKFNTFWNDKNDQDCLITSIHWYVEANNSAGAIVGSRNGAECIGAIIQLDYCGKKQNAKRGRC
jgi:hypothetical protein